MAKRTYNIDLCLTDLYNVHSDRVRKVKTKDGEKMYISLKIIQQDSVNQYGNDAFVALNVKQGDEKPNEKTIIGSAMSAAAIEAKWGNK